jgi:hypothetical protein
MKAFLWMVTLALGLMCFLLWGLVSVEMKSLADFHGDSALPLMTGVLLSRPAWLLFCPVPWIVWSLVLSFRREVTTATGFVFLGTAILAASLILFPVLIAAVLPWLPMKCTIGG